MTITLLLRRPQAFKLEPLVAYNAVKVGEKQLAELGNQLREMVGADPPASVSECTTFVKSRKDEWALSDADVVKVRISLQPLLCCGSGAGTYPSGFLAVLLFGLHCQL